MMAFGYFLKVFILTFFITEGLCIAKWYMHTMCKRFLFGNGGELILDESLLPRHQDSCFVTIVGNGSQHNKISFFFSSFYVGSDCQGNVTLVDGIADLFVRKVVGLEKSLCKYSGLDERSLFETRERYLGIMFHRRRDRWRTSANVSLTLKFVSFKQEGEPCDPEDTGKMHQCKNGRCISTDVLCRDLNPCGDFSDACEESAIQQTTAKLVLSTPREPCDPEDTGKMHQCKNGRCISTDVLCRDLNPCGDFSDACEESGIQQTTAKLVLSTSKYIFIAIGVVVGLLCLAQGCFVVRRCCFGRKDDTEQEENSVHKTKHRTKDFPESHNFDETGTPDNRHVPDNDDLVEGQGLLLNSIPITETDTDTEVKYSRTDSDKDLCEEITNELMNAKNKIETETHFEKEIHTSLKRTYR